MALEIKSSARVHESDIRSLLAMAEDGAVKKMMVVCLEKEPRRLHPLVEVVPWADFVDSLWAGEVI